MRVLVTGSNGYLGGWVINKLESAGHVINGMDSHGNKVYVSKSIQGQDWFGINTDAVVHLAWYSSVGDKHRELHEECLNRTRELVRKIADRPAYEPLPLLLFTSTASVYGHYGYSPVGENAATHPQCAYTQCKLEAEDYIRTHLNKFTILRLGSLMGVGAPGYRTKTEVIVNAFSVDALKRGRIGVWNGTDYKPIIHVQDAARVIATCIDRQIKGIMNVAATSCRAIDVARRVSGLTKARIDEMEDLSGCGHRSINLGCDRMNMEMLWKMKTIEETVGEFETYEESPTDKNTPWKTATNHLV